MAEIAGDPDSADWWAEIARAALVFPKYSDYHYRRLEWPIDAEVYQYEGKLYISFANYEAYAEWEKLRGKPAEPRFIYRCLALAARW